MPASDVPGEQAVADPADPGQAAAVRRPVPRRDERHRHRRGQPRVGPRPAAEDPERAGLQPAEPARDRRHPRLPRRGELVGGLVRPDDRPALRQLEQRPEHHHAGRVQAGRQRRDTGRIGHTGYVQFLDHEGYPAIKPPWGVLNAINLNTGEFAWQVPLGEHAELTARGIPRTGTETFGGSIVTAGGLVFIAGTKDERIHAFDKQTGRLLWEHPLPAGRLRDPFDLSGRTAASTSSSRPAAPASCGRRRAMRSWRSACRNESAIALRPFNKCHRAPHCLLVIVGESRRRVPQRILASRHVRRL